MVWVRISNDSPAFDIPKPTKVLVWGRVVGDLALFLLAMCSVILAFATSIGSLHLGEVGLNKKTIHKMIQCDFLIPYLQVT